MKKKYLTKTQRHVLQAFADNGGRCVIYTGTRWSSYAPGRVHLFAQALPHILHEGFITSKGQNAMHSYAWTAAGKLAHERGWYPDEVKQAHWLRPQEDPAP